MRRFPLLDAKAIPWRVAEDAYREYRKRYGSQQSMERLAERGGFSTGEMDMLYPQWRDAVLRVEEGGEG